MRGEGEVGKEEGTEGRGVREERGEREVGTEGGMDREGGR